VPVAVLAVWDVGQKEPWYLATNLDDDRTTEICYRRRMRIEAGNRDDKTGVLLRQGGDQHKLTSVLHLHRLLLANLCLHWLAALTGLQAHHDLAQPQAVAPASNMWPPDDPDFDLLDHGPASRLLPSPHRSSSVAPAALDATLRSARALSAMCASAWKSWRQAPRYLGPAHRSLAGASTSGL